VAKVQFILTDVDDLATNYDYQLYQNYPNPFNPTTTIEFTLKEKAYTELVVYDLLGREIKKLIAEEINKGKHSIQFDGQDLPSGVYFYRLKSGNFVQTKKMILQK